MKNSEDLDSWLRQHTSLSADDYPYASAALVDRLSVVWTTRIRILRLGVVGTVLRRTSWALIPISAVTTLIINLGDLSVSGVLIYVATLVGLLIATLAISALLVTYGTDESVRAYALTLFITSLTYVLWATFRSSTFGAPAAAIFAVALGYSGLLLAAVLTQLLAFAGFLQYTAWCRKSQESWVLSELIHAMSRLIPRGVDEFDPVQHVLDEIQPDRKDWRLMHPSDGSLSEMRRYVWGLYRPLEDSELESWAALHAAASALQVMFRGLLDEQTIKAPLDDRARLEAKDGRRHLQAIAYTVERAWLEEFGRRVASPLRTAARRCAIGGAEAREAGARLCDRYLVAMMSPNIMSFPTADPEVEPLSSQVDRRRRRWMNLLTGLVPIAVIAVVALFDVHIDGWIWLGAISWAASFLLSVIDPSAAQRLDMASSLRTMAKP